MNSAVDAVVLRNLLQSLVLADAVLDVHHVVADGEIAEVGDEGRGLRLRPLPDACSVTSRIRRRDRARRRGRDSPREARRLRAQSLQRWWSRLLRREVRRVVDVSFARSSVRLPMRNDTPYSLKTSARRSTSPVLPTAEHYALAFGGELLLLLRRRPESSHGSAMVGCEPKADLLSVVDRRDAELLEVGASSRRWRRFHHSSGGEVEILRGERDCRRRCARAPQFTRSHQ